MITSELASLIIGIEENVRPESEYYGKLVKWREKYQTWHYGIGLSDTHFFSLGNLEKQELQLLKRHDIRDFDLRILPDVKSPFESDEVIERLKYALRWLHDLPENSSQKTITGKELAFQILTGNPDYEYSGDTKLIPPDLSYEDYLKQVSPKLQHSKLGDFLGNRKNWPYIFLFLFAFLIVVAIGLINDGYGFVTDMPWLRWMLFLLLFLLIIANVAIVSNWIANFKWSGFQKKSFWDWLQLLIIPLMLALGAFYLNSAADFRDNQIAQEQKQQEILTDYFSKMQDLIVETKKSKQTPGSKESNSKERLLLEFRPTAQALTLSVLEQLDGKRKGKVITYLAESQLITITADNNVTADNNKPSPQPEIKLDGANLDDIKLGNNGQRNSLNENEMTIIDKIKINNASMKRANLSGLQLLDSDLSGSNLENATLENVDFTGSIMVGSRFITGQIIDVNFTDVRLGKSIFDNVKLENIKISDKTNFDNACFTKIDTSNTKQEPYLLIKEHLKKLIDKKNVLEATTHQECIQKIKNAIRHQNQTNFTGAK
ncbi:MAG: pentapeptide repeat-containing protein [Microcystis aeruginosa Ma_MB_F_20061100_S20]|uniref:Pentapeptide repeat-containing protein n=1 Tax=Microcystis aeruginosa Ma_MB_F_20061100_S20D TaxID=2486253 RepID=A0A552ENA2_MICAE|nr:MAG: pentapeptide repeat-containing protein [Microcystis aeruginosa Ma_MB_F_20061100_S20D]TRU38761.1 MAG: pentapeptide repeat-containing protein [Microcystis aeruginosa Ma_MB_F_20061100_S20]